MKAHFTLMAFLWFVITSHAQISLTATSGTLSGSYASLKASFDAINAGTHQGSISISVTANTSESASAVLNASGSGSASYTSVTIQPSGGASRTISGSIAGNLISLNGADQVSIDGLNSGGNSLTLDNSSTSTSAVTVAFNNDACNNSITRCTVKGSTGGVTTIDGSTRGVIYFGSTAPSSGNDNNTISYCKVGPSGSNPWCTVFSYGSSTAGRENSGNTVEYCELYDYFFNFTSGHSANTYDAGVYLGYYGNTGWNIRNNSFYQTASRNKSSDNTGNNISAIYIACGDGYQISGNYIGGGSAMCGGSAMTYTGNAYQFIPIKIRGGNIPSVNTTYINDNTIQNISFTTGSTSNSTNNSVPRFAALHFGQGRVSVNNNLLGSNSVNGSVSITQTNGTFSYYCLWTPAAYSNYTVVLEKFNRNTISGVSISATYFDAEGVHVESYTGNSLDSLCFNTIGSETLSNSIQIATATPSVTRNSFLSIFVSAIANGSRIISGNTISNVSRGSGSTDWIVGLYLFTPNSTVSNNTIHNIQTANASEMFGIYCDGINTIVKNNFIKNLGSDASSASFVHGIYHVGSSGGEISNNIVTLGNKTGGGSFTTRPFAGITSRYATNVYMNTVYIGGNSTSGNSYCYYDYFNSSSRSIRDNNLINFRSNTAGTAKHYAVYYYGTSGLTSDYNNYYVAGSGGTLAYLSSDRTSLATLRGATGQDAASISADPSLMEAGGTDAVDYLPTSAALVAGTTIAGLGNDYFGYGRPGTPTIGAIESSNPLPVVLISFSATAESNGKVRLQWVVASESQCASYIAERSKDLEGWETIARVTAAGTCTHQLGYSVFDETPLNGHSYYRLIQTDYDGTEKAIAMDDIVFEASAEEAFVYPNPATDHICIINLQLIPESVYLLDVNGRRLHLNPEVSARGLLCNLAGFPAGVYTLVLEYGSVSKTSRIVIR